MGGMVGLLGNTGGSIVALIAVLAAVAWWKSRDQWAAMRAFVREQLRLLLTYEVLFLGVFALWALYKAYNPEIAYTEKPMEAAFLNGILRSDTFPPLDPWLSGFSISYYYFGYVLVAIVTRLSGLPSSVAYNLAVPLLMALTVTGAFSVVFNLTGIAAGGSASIPKVRRARMGAAGLGAFFVAVMGNLEGFLELLHAKGVGSADFWNWLDIRNLATAPASQAWYPVDNWWWWRASRVINDTVLGVHREIIDEFPFFSFMLADLHPHVLALPFTLLALALALNLVAEPAATGEVQQSLSRIISADTLRLGLTALCLGALGFLNSWDFPTYVGIVVLAFGLRRLSVRGRVNLALLEDVLAFGLAVGGLGLALYLPFYLTFQSQASGIGLVLIEKTRLPQYLVIFGVFLWALLPLLGPRRRRPPRWWWVALAVVAAPTFVSGWLGWWTVLLLLALLMVAGLRLEDPGEGAAPASGEGGGGEPLARRFALGLMMVGLLLTLFTEFAFIRDTFGNRMNTVFKFYYQAWVLLAIAGAFGVYWSTTDAGRRRMGRTRPVWAAVLALLVAAGAYYPLAAGYTKANLLSVPPTLDGTDFIARFQPGDYGAIQWLNGNVKGAPVILEATGGEYSDYARISTFTGLPTVLGWGGHELQWRGNYVEPGKREPDIETMYRSTDVQLVRSLMVKYGVKYVIVGRMEREKGYDALSLGKFGTFMDVVYDSGGTTIYRSRQ
jgi:YYY domain-containing protein